MAKILIQMRAEQDWIDVIDAWRRETALTERHDISRSEAIRRLALDGLKAQKTKSEDD